MLQLKSYKPGELYKEYLKKHKNDLKYSSGSDFSDDYVDFELKCWSCKHKFLIAISAANMHCNIFGCPYCKEANEIE